MTEEFINVTGINSLHIWIDRFVAKLPKTAGKDMLKRFANENLKSIRAHLNADAIYHSEHPGRLGKSFAYHFTSPYNLIIDSSHPGARAANDGMTSFKSGQFRKRFPGGKWRTIKAPGKIMTKSRALHFVEYSVISVTKKMDGIIDQCMKKRGLI